MSKVYESDVDPDEFIRSFREESSKSTVKKRMRIRLKHRPELRTPNVRKCNHNLYRKKMNIWILL